MTGGTEARHRALRRHRRLDRARRRHRSRDRPSPRRALLRPGLALHRHPRRQVEKFAGDAVMAAFGVPLAHEDDAERAVRAALATMERVKELGLRARVGIESGEVVAEDTESTFATGEAVNLAARLQQRPATTRSSSARTRRGSSAAGSSWSRCRRCSCAAGRSRSRRAASSASIELGAPLPRSTRRSSVAPPSSTCSRTRSPAPPATGARRSSRSTASRASARAASPASSSRGSRAPRCSRAAASRTARASRGGRSPRW